VLNYMRALCRQFDCPSNETKALEHKVNQAHKQLSSQLDKPERKLLLRLIDIEDILRNQACLNSFVSGFHLAMGIHQELNEQIPYSFEAEETQRICELANRKENRHGKA